MKRSLFLIPLLALSCSIFSQDIFDEKFINSRKKEATKEEITRSYGLFNDGFNLRKESSQNTEAEKKICEAIRLYPAPNYYEELGNIYFDGKNFSKSLKAYKIAILFSKEKNYVLFYNAACAASMNGEPGEGFHLLEQALASGYRNFKMLETDPDLNELRKVKEFKTLINRYRK